jgi:hypothetical protein
MEAIPQVWKRRLGSSGNTFRVNIGEVQESEDWAHDVGTFTSNSIAKYGWIPKPESAATCFVYLSDARMLQAAQRTGLHLETA